MKEQKLDTYFREQLQDYSSAVPGDMWERISRDNDKDRRTVFFLPRLMFAAALVLVLAVSGYLVFRSYSNNPSTAAVLKNNKGASQPAESGNQVQQPAVNAANANKATAPASSVTAATARNIPEPVLHNNAIQRNNGQPVAGDVRPGSGREIFQDQQKRLDNTTSVNKTNGTAASSADDLVLQQPANAAPAAGKGQDSLGLMQPTTGINGTSASAAANNNLPSPGNMPSKPAAVKTVQKNKKGISIEVFGGPELASKKMSGTVSQINIGSAASFQNNYVAWKNKTEATHVSYAAGIRISKPLFGHVSLKSGFHYRDVMEQFTASSNDPNQYSIITPRFITTATGGTLAVADTSYMAGSQIPVKQLNHYRSFSIPVLLSYEIAAGKTIAIAATAGASFNLYTWYHGYTITNNNTAVPFSSTHDYKHHTGADLYLAVSAMKKLGRNVSIFAEPHLQYNFSGMTTRSASFKQKINAAGLSIGARFTLSQHNKKVSH